MIDLNQNITVNGSIDMLERISRLNDEERGLLDTAVAVFFMVMNKNPKRHVLEIRFNPRMI